MFVDLGQLQNKSLIGYEKSECNHIYEEIDTPAGKYLGWVPDSIMYT
jgi:hypothetical protein